MRLVWIALGVAAAGTAIAARGVGDPAPPPRLAIAPAVESPAAPARATGPFVGDGALAGQLDVRRIERVGDAYEAPLSDGRRARLTLEQRYQEAAEFVLRQTRAPRATVVAMRLDGRIVALAGRRAADPKGGLDGESDPTLALDVWAPAASIFKIATAAALVRSGVSADERVCYHGGVRSVMASNLVDDRRDRACQDLSYGLAHSQNAIIGKLAARHLTPTVLASTAADLGFSGELTDWVLPGPRGHVEVPVEPLALAKAAAGFSGSYLSAMSGAVMASTVAAGGAQPTPTLIAEVIDETGARSPVTPTTPARVLEPDVARQVARMMAETCQSGSAARSFASRAKDAARAVAGKTGTLAQDEPYMEFSWFVGFAPVAEPEVAFAVLIGNAENWWMKAHTAARELLDRAAGRGPGT